MKVRAKSGKYAGEALAFRITGTGEAVFTVMWYGHPGTHEVSAMDLESVN